MIKNVCLDFNSLESINPVRSPRWRYDRVLELLRAGGLPRRGDDFPIRLLHRYLSWSADAGHDASKVEAIESRYPDAVQVQALYYSRPIELRQILESRLLTNETFQQIAASTGVPPAVVELYEQLFFNVRDRLQARGWIYKVIHGHPNRRVKFGRGNSISEEERGFLYRWIGYHGGPVALDAFMAGMSGCRELPGGRDVHKWLGATRDDAIQAQAIAVMLLGRGPQSIRFIKLAAKKMRQIKSVDEPHSQDELNRRLAQMLKEWAIGIETGFSGALDEGVPGATTERSPFFF